MSNVIRSTILGALIVINGGVLAAGDQLEASFVNPPQESKPLTWWHWIDGNATKGGITRDLESMKRAGLGGCYLFSIGGFFPQGPLVFGSSEWYDMLVHTVNEADRLGLVFGVHNCDGWSQSGGPWITPETSMKELTWTTVDVDGPDYIDFLLPTPEKRMNFYRDIAVVAFPLPRASRWNGEGTEITGSNPSPVLGLLSDGNLTPRAVFPVSPEGHRVQIKLPGARLLRSLTFLNVNGSNSEEDIPVLIEASLDGERWLPAGESTFTWDTGGGAKPITVAFEEHHAQFLRLSFTNSLRVEIGEIEVSDAAKVHFGEAKAARLRTRGHGGETRNFAECSGPNRHRQVPEEAIVQRARVQDLRARTDRGGRLSWQVPPGRWRIMRVGYTTNGRYVKPATIAGRGLECDKLDPETVRFHMGEYVGRLAKAFGPRTGKVFAAVETDSWECDVQNWTAGFERRFKAETGYDIIPWLPLLLEGWVMDGPDASERMLWDWRRFLADQIAKNYFAQVKKYLDRLNVTYVSEGSGRQMYLYDAVGYQRNGDVPMGEFWINTGPAQGVRVDNKVAASVAHIAGKRIVASESYTASAPFARWDNHPYTLKPLGDRAFSVGVNQFVFHTFAHQPYEVTGPGFAMARWGLNCNRANTWWEPGRAWMKYLARCNHLLREGKFVADVLSFVGEDVPNRIGWRSELAPPLPESYDFDGCDADALRGAKVKDGRIVLSSGMEYRVLLLPEKTTIRPEVLRDIARLVRSGATVVGRRPEQSPGLANRDRNDALVREFASGLWGRCDGVTVKENKYGRGQVFWGLGFAEVFERLNLPPDFEYENAASDAEVLYIHRRIGDSDFYFLSNQKPRPERIIARFRVKGKQPEIWDPVSGSIHFPGLFRVRESCVEMPLDLDLAGSLFVVFRAEAPRLHVISASSPDADIQFDASGQLAAWLGNGAPVRLVMSDGTERNTPAIEPPAPVRLGGEWNVAFPPGLGAPASATFHELVSWTERTEKGIRFFSGTAIYTTEFGMPEWVGRQNVETWLDLGSVQVIAEVRLNGKDLGILWKPPFRIKVADHLRPGQNRLEVRVTNLWPNRMIGDENLPETTRWENKAAEPMPERWPEWLLEGKPRPDGRITYCTRKPYKKDDPLLPSGLLGPVQIQSVLRHNIN